MKYAVSGRSNGRFPHNAIDANTQRYPENALNSQEEMSEGDLVRESAPRVLVLGPFRIARVGHREPARTRQVGRVGALLAASPGIPVSRDHIIETLWGSQPPQTAVNTLQVHISQLRAMASKDMIATVGEGYVLAVEPLDVDAEWFKCEILECLDAATTGPAALLRDRLTRALALWQGEPFAELAAPEIAARRSELVELRERALETHLDLSLRVADSPRALCAVIAAAKGQVTRQPLRESGHEILIRALIADGRPAEAVEAFRSAVEVLFTKAGVAPSARLCVAIEPVVAKVK